MEAFDMHVQSSFAAAEEVVPDGEMHGSGGHRLRHGHGLLPGLLLKEGGVNTVQLEQLLMVAAFEDTTCVENADLIRQNDRAEPVGIHQHGVLPFELIDRLLRQTLALGVKGTGGFIEDKQFGIARDGTGQGKALALAQVSTQPIATLGDEAIEALGKMINEVGI